MIQKSWMPISILLIYSLQYLFMFYLKVNHIGTILQKYNFDCSLNCNMIDILTRIIVPSSSFGIIFSLHQIVACVISLILYSITAQSCGHRIFRLILFIKDGLLTNK